MTIPRIIHQTIPSKAEMHPAFIENINALRGRNPGWEHRIYDDKDIQAFILEYYGSEILKTYQLINPCYGPAKADVFRYLLLYKVGGVYLDIKSTCEKKS